MYRVFLLFILLSLGCSEKDIYYEIVASDYVNVGSFSQGLEGPAVDQFGNLFFVNPIKKGTIGRVSKNGSFEVFVDSLPNGSVANGIRFGAKGEMFLADYVNHNILQLDVDSKTIVLYAHDSTMNQPNDIAISDNGTLYASDPNWGDGNGKLWRIDTDGSAHLLADSMGTTNGVEVAPGDTILYVNESVQRKVWKFELSKSGEITNKRLLFHYSDRGLDGMRCDIQGNIYVARYGAGTIDIISPKGIQIGKVQLTAKKPTNLSFGGVNGRTCYVTCQDRPVIETFDAPFAGRSRY